MEQFAHQLSILHHLVKLTWPLFTESRCEVPEMLPWDEVGGEGRGVPIQDVQWWWFKGKERKDRRRWRFFDDGTKPFLRICESEAKTGNAESYS